MTTASTRARVLHEHTGEVLAVQCMCTMWVHPSVTECLAAASPEQTLTAAGAAAPPPAAPILTMLERRVLTGLAAGTTRSQMAREMYVTEDQVKYAALTLRKALGVGSNPEAVLVGYRLGLLT